MGWLGTVFSFLFGGSSGGKSIAEEAVDVVDNYKPGVVTEHKMDIETAQVEESAVQDARNMQMPTHDDVFNRIVDGLNRLPRPLFSFWAFIILVLASFGLMHTSGFSQLDDFTKELIRTVIYFFFGVRVVSQDIPTAIKKVIDHAKGT